MRRGPSGGGGSGGGGGATGPTGPAGADGAPGATGAAGATGATGPNWTAGAALVLTGDVLDVAVDGVGLEVSADALRLKDSGVTLAKQANLAESTVIGRAAGAGTGVPTALSVAQINTIISGLGGITPTAGTFLTVVAGAWAAANTTGYVALGNDTPQSTVGLVRFSNAAQTLLAFRNVANTADISALETSGTNILTVGSDAALTSTKQAGQTRLCSSGNTDLVSAATTALRITATLVATGAPIVGLAAVAGNVFSAHGRATQAMADANQTLAAAIYSRQTIRTTGLLTANRTITFPHPSSEDRSYSKDIENDCSGAFGIVVSTGTGTTVTVANTALNLQSLSFTPSGVRAKSPPTT